jgi:hypothetical protein
VIDLPTLRLAADAVTSRLGLTMRLPTICDGKLPTTLADMAVVEVQPGPSVVATIDTGKMDWGATERPVREATFSDYGGAYRMSVLIGRRPFAVLDQIAVANADVRLPGGRTGLIWFAEVPTALLASSDLYGLARLAGELTSEFNGAGPVVLDHVMIPAQKIKYRRRMPEIEAINPGVVKDAEQRLFMALDHTGVRVKAVTQLRAASWHGGPPPTSHHFGAQHPVTFWFTEVVAADSVAWQMPFAVIITNRLAWLEVGTKVSFADSEFTF